MRIAAAHYYPAEYAMPDIYAVEEKVEEKCPEDIKDEEEQEKDAFFIVIYLPLPREEEMEWWD